MIDGEEAFILEMLRPQPTQAHQRFVLEGWEDGGDHATPSRTPYMLPSGHRLRKRALQRRQEAEEQRKKAVKPRFTRWFQKMAELQHRFLDRLRNGFHWLKDSVLGGNRKRTAETEGATDGPAKRPRLDDVNTASVHSEDHGEGQVEAIAVPDFDVHQDFGFDDFEYGEEEDRAATNAILAAGDEFNGDDGNNNQPIDNNNIVEPIPQLDPEEDYEDAGDAVVEDAEMGEDVEANIVDEQPGAIHIQQGEAPITPIRPAQVVPLQRPENAKALRNLARRDPFAVIQTARGDGFQVQLFANGTAKITGTISGIDCRRSSFFDAISKGGVTITAPHYSRIVEVVAGKDHAILRTSRGRLMLVGSNAFKQLGSCPSRRPDRLASQTLGSVQRGPVGIIAKLKITGIQAVGNESWAWDSEGRAYHCGSGDDWWSSVFRPDPRQDIHP